VPWWSWVIIWVVLVAALLGMLAWFAVRLFRKLMTAADALGDLGDQLAQLDEAVDELAPATFSPAIFADREELALDVERNRDRRAHRRQERRDLAINRGKLLRHAPIE
jgi:flagellar biosynthesis/type III secretory pathway M-ring protein FliF/YscJ